MKNSEIYNIFKWITEDSSDSDSDSLKTTSSSSVPQGPFTDSKSLLTLKNTQPLMIEVVCESCDNIFKKHWGSDCMQCGKCNSVAVERKCLSCYCNIRVGYFAKKGYKRYFCKYCISIYRDDMLDKIIKMRDITPIKNITSIKDEEITKPDFICKRCSIKVYVTGGKVTKYYCDKCYQLESEIRLHNSIIAVAQLYLRNEDWLNEIIDQGCCYLCDKKMRHKRRIVCDYCMYCCQDIKDVQTGTIDKDKIYKNVYLKITFYQSKRYGNREIYDRYTYNYPLLKTIKQSNINFDNNISNLNLLQYYQHPEHLLAKIESAKVKYKIILE